MRLRPIDVFIFVTVCFVLPIAKAALGFGVNVSLDVGFLFGGVCVVILALIAGKAAD